MIRIYEVQFVPGLLQTRGLRPRGHHRGAGRARPRRRSSAGSSMRMHRQELLSKPGGPRLWAVVDEAALRRPIGSQEVFRVPSSSS